MQLDGNSTLLIALGIIALVAIVYAVRYGGSGKTKVSGPFGMSVEAEGKNIQKSAKPSPKSTPEKPPAFTTFNPTDVAIDLKNVKAGGNVKTDAEGKIKADGVEAGKDFTASSKQPPQGTDAPKA